MTPTTKLPNPSTEDPAALEPPAEEFWHKYSPHYEFPISNVASIAIHVLAVGLIIFITTRLMDPEKKAPVPIRGMLVKNEPQGGLAGEKGGGGGDPMEAKEAEPMDPLRKLPEVELSREIVAASAWIPELKDNAEALKQVVQSPNFDKLRDLNEDIKKRFAQGIGGTKGKGAETGTGMGEAGKGSGGTGGPGDATTSGSRSLRWTIVFKTSSGEDYLKQLAAFEAKVAIPEPPDWKKNRLFEDITMPNAGKPLSSTDDLPDMMFKDEDKVSAAKIARALGLTYSPPWFIAFFPKSMENKMSDMEKDYRKLKEDQIYSTTFRVVERDGKYEIKVTEQIRKQN